MDILNPWARAAISRPIRPIPKMPSLLPLTFVPSGRALLPDHNPARTKRSPAHRLRCRQQQCKTKVRHIVGEDVRRRRDTDAPSFRLSEDRDAWR